MVVWLGVACTCTCTTTVCTCSRKQHRQYAANNSSIVMNNDFGGVERLLHGCVSPLVGHMPAGVRWGLAHPTGLGGSEGGCLLQPCGSGGGVGSCSHICMLMLVCTTTCLSPAAAAAPGLLMTASVVSCSQAHGLWCSPNGQTQRTKSTMMQR